MTAGRLWSLVAGALGVAGIAVLVLTRGRGALVAVVTGGIGAVIGALVVVMAQGGPGTGYGIVGGYITLVLGVVTAGLGVAAGRRGARAAARRDG
ncbi:hypothetical protein SAMN05216188_12641 [Lentzea xinjiangensis]|uniref:Uncharacterized protein n=2 Tax=Lentzea xinjiangensis TaxID=402600 RepID=A0A1H9VGR3_9PSEU|nr:hypothetical protein SAMN05216188_12641 [Lentzea xinjiangensis]